MTTYRLTAPEAALRRQSASAGSDRAETIETRSALQRHHAETDPHLRTDRLAIIEAITPGPNHRQ
jgi:hypothetical protein